MPTSPQVAFASVWEDSSLWVAARVVNIAAVNVSRATLSGVSLSVYDTDDADVVTVDDESLTVSDVVFDTLQTSSDDVRWTTDATGYNFAYTIPASAFPEGNRLYWAKFTFDPVSGDDFYFVLKVTSSNLPGQ